MNRYKIYIPSKWRVDLCLTAELLDKYWLEYKLVIEPQEYESYKKKYGEGKLLQLDKNDQGLPYSRNWIIEYSKSLWDKYHWQFDDDVIDIKIREQDKNISINPYLILEQIEDYVDKYNNIAVAWLRDITYAWSQKDILSFNKLVTSTFLVNNAVDVRFQNNVIWMNDWCLQVLLKWYCTVLFNRLIHHKKPDQKFPWGLNCSKLTPYRILQQNLVNKYSKYMKMTVKNWEPRIAASRIRLLFKQRPNAN